MSKLGCVLLHPSLGVVSLSRENPARLPVVTGAQLKDRLSRGHREYVEDATSTLGGTFDLDDDRAALAVSLLKDLGVCFRVELPDYHAGYIFPSLLPDAAQGEIDAWKTACQKLPFRGRRYSLQPTRAEELDTAFPDILSPITQFLGLLGDHVEILRHNIPP